MTRGRLLACGAETNIDESSHVRSTLWVEEVCQLESEVLPELRQIRAQTRVPLATGERLVSRYGFAPLCSERLVDVIMPDVVHCGGISDLRKIAAMAETFRVEVSPHNPQSEVSTLASLH